MSVSSDLCPSAQETEDSSVVMFYIIARGFVMLEDACLSVPLPHYFNVFTKQFRYVFLTFYHHKGHNSHICKMKGLCREERASERASTALINGGVDILLGVTTEAVTTQDSCRISVPGDLSVLSFFSVRGGQQLLNKEWDSTDVVGGPGSLRPLLQCVWCLFHLQCF